MDPIDTACKVSMLVVAQFRSRQHNKVDSDEEDSQDGCNVLAPQNAPMSL